MAHSLDDMTECCLTLLSDYCIIIANDDVFVLPGKLKNDSNNPNKKVRFVLFFSPAHTIVSIDLAACKLKNSLKSHI